MLALLAPQLALTAVPWIWNLASGHWALRTIETVHWHHVRCAAPMAALLLATGLSGYARAAAFLSRRAHARAALVGLWVVAVLGLARTRADPPRQARCRAALG